MGNRLGRKKKAKLNLGLDDGVFVRMALGLEKLIVTCLFFFFFFAGGVCQINTGEALES